mmetsp:Transcript_4000/g.12594  ORF Transcript_4000/g.12594 Transcript_4000/m.12594 type:complete len:430 (+) Transcript_4000:68-1357(+)
MGNSRSLGRRYLLSFLTLAFCALVVGLTKRWHAVVAGDASSRYGDAPVALESPSGPGALIFKADTGQLTTTSTLEDSTGAADDEAKPEVDPDDEDRRIANEIAAKCDAQGCKIVEDLPTVFVASHRRSGTHLTMDFIYNAFAHAGKGLNVVKTNHIEALQGKLSCECFNWMRSRGKIIHAKRFFPDVAISYYNYVRHWDKKFRTSYPNLEAFITSNKFNDLVDTYVNAVEGWRSLAPDVLSLDFDDTVMRLTPEYVQKIADFLELPWAAEHKGKSLFDESDWDLKSKPVWRNAGLGAEGYKQKFDNATVLKMLEHVDKHPFWNNGPLLRCPPANPPPPDRLCTASSAIRTTYRMVSPGRPLCKVIGSKIGNVLNGDIRTRLCPPQSCPDDLFSGVVVTSYKGEDRTSRLEKSLVSNRKSWPGRHEFSFT